MGALVCKVATSLQHCVCLRVYRPPVSVHCYRLFREENAQVRVDGKRNGARREGWVGVPGRGCRDEEHTGRKQLVGQS